MSGEWEYDPYEYAEELAAGEDLGRSDLSTPERTEDERGGLTRRELIARGGAGAAMVGGLGALAGPAAAARQGSSEVDANGKFTGTLRVLSLGVEFPIPDIAKQASKDLGFTVKPILAPSEKQPQIAITSPDTFDVFGGYNYQSLQVWPSGGLQPVDTRRLKSWAAQYKLFTHGKLNPASGAAARSARATRRSGRRSSTRTAPPACRRTPTARRATGRSSAGSARTASRSAGSRSRAGSSARRRTSTPTPWATTPT